MTDNEIIQAFEACYTNKYTDCDECPYYCRKENRCVDMIVDGVPTLPKNILDLINRLKAENERLKQENQELKEKGKKAIEEIQSKVEDIETRTKIAVALIKLAEGE